MTVAKGYVGYTVRDHKIRDNFSRVVSSRGRLRRRRLLQHLFLFRYRISFFSKW